MAEAPSPVGGGPSSAEDGAGGKLGRALRLGERTHALYWHGSQAWLTRSSIDWGLASAALNEVIALLDPNPHPVNGSGAALLRSAWTALDGAFGSLLFNTSVAAINWGLHGKRLAKFTDFAADVGAAREEHLARFLRPKYLRECIFEGFDEGERGGFELGEVIDQGVRPPGVYRRLPVPEEKGWWSALNYLGSHGFRPGELPPDESWPRELAARWQVVLGVPLGLERHIQAIGGSTDGPSKRCALVAHLLKLARLASVRVAGQGNRPSTSAASVQPVAESDSIPAAPDLNPFPLQFDDRVDSDLRITNSRGETAPFRGQKKLFAFVSYVYERTVSKQPCPDKELVTEFWPHRVVGTSRDNSVSRAITNANTLLLSISCKLCTEKDGLWVRACDARG